MNRVQWKEYLHQLSIDVLERLEDAQYSEIPALVKETRWLGFDAATEDELHGLETRLGKKLPGLYRKFLSASNGWRNLDQFVDRLWSADDVDWFYVKSQDAANAWIDSPGYVDSPRVQDDEYLTYGPDQDPARIRVEYLRIALEVGAGHDSTFVLLNPEVVHDGEWETWMLATWLPGAQRLRSFEEMVRYVHTDFVNAFPKLRTLTPHP